MPEKAQREELRRTLTALHQLLEETEEVGDETRQAMQLVAGDLGRVLNEDQADSEDTHPSQLREQWQAAVLDFESKHPRLAQTVDQITSLLANLGI